MFKFNVMDYNKQSHCVYYLTANHYLFIHLSIGPQPFQVVTHQNNQLVHMVHNSANPITQN